MHVYIIPRTYTMLSIPGHTNEEEIPMVENVLLPTKLDSNGGKGKASANANAMLPDYPIQLVRPDPVHHRHLEIIEANVKYLHHINSAVALVAVVGKYHSGKSFLLNQLMRKQRGFGIGPTVRPETMGIWMWGKVNHQMLVKLVTWFHVFCHWM